MSRLFRKLCTGMLTLATGLTAGCEEEPDKAPKIDPAYEGIYKLSAYTKNDKSCDAQGASVLEVQKARFVVLVRSTFVAIETLQAYGCEDTATCRSIAAGVKEQKGSFTVQFSFGFSEVRDDGTLHGQGSSTGGSSGNGVCTGGSVYDQILRGKPRGSISLEKRTTLADYPADSEGFCSTDGARQATAGRPCSVFEVISADFAEPLLNFCDTSPHGASLGVN